MTFNYLVYPDALNKLEKSGLAKRINAAKNNDFPSIYSIVREDELKQDINELYERKYIPKFMQEKFLNLLENCDGSISRVIQKQDKEKLKVTPHWVIKKQDMTERVSADLEDLQIATGVFASYVLDQKEFWNPEKFGFKSVNDLWGLIGAYAKMDKISIRDGYKWKSKLDDQLFISEVTGSEHGDFRLNRQNITPCQTIDPLGRSVSYRPVSRSDETWVSGYHSVEPMLLATIIRFVEQKKVESKILNNNAQEIIKEFRGMKHGLGLFADAGYEDYTRESSNLFITADSPIPKVDSPEVPIRLSHYIYTEQRGAYWIFTDKDKNLLFFYESEENQKKRSASKNQPKKENWAFGVEGKSNFKEPAFVLPASEVDQLIYGLFIQAANGLGRTSVKQLVDILEYRYSDKYLNDKKQFEEFSNKSNN